MNRREHDPKVAYPWFLNLLPEGRALETIGAVLKISELDVFAMLEDMGGDLPGALEIHRKRPEDYAHEPGIRPLTEAELAECIRLLPDRPVLVGEEGITMSAAGAQDKLPVIRLKDGRLALPTYGMPSTHILKPRNEPRDEGSHEATGRSSPWPSLGAVLRREWFVANPAQAPRPSDHDEGSGGGTESRRTNGKAVRLLWDLQGNLRICHRLLSKDAVEPQDRTFRGRRRRYTGRRRSA